MADPITILNLIEGRKHRDNERKQATSAMLILTILALLMCIVSAYQNTTIQQQRDLIKQMSQNPACMGRT